MKPGKRVLRILWAVFLASLVLFTSSCSPRIIEKVRTEYVYRDRYLRDSLYFRDSIYIKEHVKGDTVYFDKIVYKYVYKDKLQTDTLLREVHDTTKVEVKVEKPLSKIQSAKIGAFWWLVLAVALLLLWTFRKPLLTLIRGGNPFR